jgi:hypothetical protein
MQHVAIARTSPFYNRMWFSEVLPFGASRVAAISRAQDEGMDPFAPGKIQSD